jgi:hypothetical protein
MEKQTKAEVKAYYIEQIGKFFSEIADIPDEELKGLPAVHIPCLGFTGEMPEIAFYGMETRSWFDMQEFKKSFFENPSAAYDSITKDVFTPGFVIGCSRPHGNMFWKYIISLMAGKYGLTFQQMRTETELKKHPLIWGNILALERYHVSAKRNGVKLEIYKKVYDASALFNTLPDRHWGPTYIVRACQPKFLFILYSGFNLQNWLRNDFGIEREKINKHLCCAHIEETDTYVFKLPHPVFINRRIGWEKTVKEILARWELTKTMANDLPASIDAKDN